MKSVFKNSFYLKRSDEIIWSLRSKSVTKKKTLTWDIKKKVLNINIVFVHHIQWFSSYAQMLLCDSFNWSKLLTLQKVFCVLCFSFELHLSLNMFLLLLVRFLHIEKKWARGHRPAFGEGKLFQQLHYETNVTDFSLWASKILQMNLI